MIGQLNLEQLAVYPALYSHVWLALLAMYHVIINYATKTVVINEKKNLYVICCCHGSYSPHYEFMALPAYTSEIYFKSQKTKFRNDKKVTA